MDRLLQIGRVVEVRGTRIRILVDKESNHSTMIHNGKLINNITVNGFILIKKGAVDIVGKIDAEYIEDLLNTSLNWNKDHRYNKGSILRVLEIQIVGFFENNNFENGVRHLPMIGNLTYIPTQQNINNIYEGSKVISKEEERSAKSVVLGKSVYEGIEISLSINRFYASHIGIFGNTGSGKSNTMSKLYYELFDAIEPNSIVGKSNFHVIDFNGEYGHEGIFGLPKEHVKRINLGSSDVFNKIQIEESYFDNGELLSVLFNAREQTQKPFIKRLLNRVNYAEQQGWTMSTWLKALYVESLINSSKELFEYMKTILNYVMDEINYSEKEEFQKYLNKIEWFSRDEKYFVRGQGGFFESKEKIKSTQSVISGFDSLGSLCGEIDRLDISWFTKLIINSKLNLLDDMLKKYAQFDHINPLINRIESRVKELNKTVEIVNSKVEHRLLTVYSFRECSTDIKQMIPPLIARNILDNHKKDTEQNNIKNTVHLIIDEAHNILTPQYDREGSDWHDYRLEVFEEIIKEGRKFGVYLTLASQRPSDISSTIISQVHNFFIHRLVNDKDLEMINNTISTLDRVSKNAIPTLSSGGCIVTGTALSMPIFMQVDIINEKTFRPNSDDLNLLEIWNTDE